MEKKSTKSNRRSRKDKFWEKYNFEIFIFSLFTIGVFLLIESFDIKASIIKSYFLVYKFITWSILELYLIIVNLLSNVENSDLIGLVLIIFAIFLLLLRWRQRFLNNHLTYEVCRYCNGRIHRIKRKKRVKFFAYIFRFKIKRYQCVDCNQASYIIKSL